MGLQVGSTVLVKLLRWTDTGNLTPEAMPSMVSQTLGYHLCIERRGGREDRQRRWTISRWEEEERDSHTRTDTERGDTCRCASPRRRATSHCARS